MGKFHPSKYVFRIKKTEIVDVVIVYGSGPRGWARVRGGLGEYG
jgi:hypothetical protein